MIKRWIMQWASNQAKKEMVMPCDSNMATTKGSSSGRLGHRYDDENIVNFRIYSAFGGRIVETMRYSKAGDRESFDYYVIPEGEEFDASLAKIVTMAYMR